MAKNIFNSIQVSKPVGNYFDLNHDFKFSMEMGLLVPTLVLECVPGDTHTMSANNLLRFAPMVAPLMHDVAVYNHCFFVPNRLLWRNWSKFITANNGKSTVPAVPQLPNGADFEYAIGSLGDYMGLPTGVELPPTSAIPFAAYQMIYDEYYRDQNLITSVAENLGLPDDFYLQDGMNSSNELLQIRRRAWQHDYFTASLPFAQKGGAVSLPLGDFPDVRVFRQKDNAGPNDYVSLANTSADPLIETNVTNLDRNVQESFLFANTSELQATAATINDFRRAIRLQEWLEKMARGGSRYKEQILMHFGVHSSDKRLDRPEYIGGTKTNVIISEVLQTSESNETPQANMAGHAIAGSRGNSYRYTCEEHGYIICIQSVMPKTAYQQGIPRHMSRISHLDYLWPTFAHIGEQEVLNKELFISNDWVANEQTFGYVPRYAEYRFMNSRVAGDFKNTLAFWHLGRIFENAPTLNKEFIECNPRRDIFAVQEGQYLWCHTYHNIKSFRTLPKYGTPTL